MAWLTAIRGLAEPFLPAAQVLDLSWTWRSPTGSRRLSSARYRVPLPALRCTWVWWRTDPSERVTGLRGFGRSWRRVGQSVNVSLRWGCRIFTHRVNLWSF